jgi:carbamate kinase
MRIVVALGGTALLDPGEKADDGLQWHHVQAAAQALAPLAEQHEMIICHGNGPQVGMASLETAADGSLPRTYPLDALGAQTQGMIGYWLTQSLRNAGVTKPVISVMTQIVVDHSDPSFAVPTRCVGPLYTPRQARLLTQQHGWTTEADGDQCRRVVPSPAPLRIVELDTITRLLQADTVVICSGGGGAPVVDDGGGQLHGVEALVDKDLTAALLAVSLEADRLLVLTDVPAVMRDFGTPQAAPLHRLDVADLHRMHFPVGSMAPKIDACRRFVTATGRSAVLTGATGTTLSARSGGRRHAAPANAGARMRTTAGR